MPVVDVTATGQNIQRLRIAAGMTVRDIQNACGFATTNAVYKWINGDCMPTIDNMVILATIFGVKMDDIVITRIV